MIKPNPFTPKSGQEPKVFLNRDKEISFFKKRLTELEEGRQNHYILNGAWGTGKTSLLKYLKHIAQAQGFQSAYFSVQEFTEDTEDKDITAHMLESIARALPIQFNKGSKFIKALEGFGLQVLGSGFHVNFKKEMYYMQYLFLKSQNKLAIFKKN